ncbi:MAG: ATP-dependent 6-phosphofructokinase, partial [Tissierellia bacterium]|nr:ATP-dependent 6-phosphofructokinase [Tissierellia bacterium]
DIDDVCKKIIQGRNRGKLHHIIALAEGTGNAYEVAEEIEKKTGNETRVTILGHIQRGGSPTSFDRIMASKMGHRAVELLIQGKSGKALGIKCNEIIDMDLDKALKIEKKLDMEMYEMAKILSI